MAKFVVISDLHAHPWAAFARGDGVDNTRLRRTLDVLEASLRCALEQEVPWVFAGDLVHTAGYALNVVLAEVVARLRKFPTVPKLAVWGNHDARGVGGRILEAHTVWGTVVPAVPDLTLLDPSIIGDDLVEVGGLTFSGAGAQPSVDLIIPPAKADVGVYHGTVAGSMGPNGFVFEDGINAASLYALHRISVVGDIHHPQTLAGGRILIPGSPEHHNFGDQGPHGWWLVDVDEPSRNVFMPSGSPEFRTAETPSEVMPDGNFYRVLNVSAATELPKNAIAIAPGPTTVKSRNLLSGTVQPAEAVQAWLREDPPENDMKLYRAVGYELLQQQDPAHLSGMRLRGLHLTNFCSYADQNFDVLPGTWLVTGKGRDYPSNGAGKSSLFEALYWMLFGRTTKGLTGDDVIRWGAGTCMVSAEFSDDTGGLIVIRERGDGSKLSVMETPGAIEWEATSVNQMTEKLTRRLGLTPELFQALGYFSQERLLLFASASDGERKDMLADLIGIAAYQEASAAAAGKGAALEKTRLTLEGRCEAVQAELNRERQRLTELEKQSIVWDADHTTAVGFAEHKLVEFDDRALVRMVALREQHTGAIGRNLQGKIAEQQRAIEALGQHLETYAGDGPPPTPETAELHLEKRRQEYGEATTQLATAQRDLEHFTRTRNQAADRAAAQARMLTTDGKCPQCQQAVSTAQWDLVLGPLKAEVVAAASSADTTQAVMEKLIWLVGARKLAFEEAKELLVDARGYADLEAKKAAAWQTLQTLQEQKADLVNVARTLAERDLAAERGMLESYLSGLQSQTNPHTSHVESSTARIAGKGQELTQLGQERNVVARDSAIYDYWCRGFSKQGLQSLLVEEVATRFNGIRSEIFPALTQGIYDVQFSTLSHTKAGEARERTEFLITERGKRIPYEALSGGQRRRVDVGVMLTLVMAVSDWMQVPGALGMLVLDEVFGFLDAAGAEGLMEALRAVETRIPAIYVVAHDPQLQALFPKTITVMQDQLGVSRLEAPARGD